MNSKPQINTYNVQIEDTHYYKKNNKKKLFYTE